MPLTNPFKLVEQTGLAAWVREDNFAFPVLEAMHVCAVMFVVGSIGMMDLRLLGVAARARAVTAVGRDTLPWTWVAFLLAVISGAVLMTGQAGAYAANAQFQLKMVLMILAGANMLVFHSFAWRSVGVWDLGAPPTAAKLAGGLSLLLWVGVVVAGRWVGWTVGASPF